MVITNTGMMIHMTMIAPYTIRFLTPNYKNAQFHYKADLTHFSPAFPK